jgi:hypothetical protein
MEKNVIIKIGSLLCGILIACQACQTNPAHKVEDKNMKEPYTADIEYIYIGMRQYNKIQLDTIPQGVYIHINVLNNQDYHQYLWVGNKRKENIGGFLYMVHQKDTFKFDCPHYPSEKKDNQYTHGLHWLSDVDYGNFDFERLQNELKGYKEDYKSFLANYFKNAEFYIIADTVSFNEYIHKHWGKMVKIGYPKGKIPIKKKVPLILKIGEDSDCLESHYRDWIIIYPDSILYEREVVYE